MADFLTELPDGYSVRKYAPLARSTRNRPLAQHQMVGWGGMARDLWTGGGYGWQHWGSGHTSSGITKALAARRWVEVAEAKRGALLFRLTPDGLGLLEDFCDWRGTEFPEPPAGAPTEYAPIRRKLSEEEEAEMAVLLDELDALNEAEARRAELLRGDDAPFVDMDLAAWQRRRAAEVRSRIRQFR